MEQYVTPFQIGELDLSKGIIKPSKIVVGMKELFYQFAGHFLMHLRNPDIATIMVDTGTLLYEVVCLGYLQEKQELQLNPNGTVVSGEKLRVQLQRQEYREPYIRMRGFLYQAKASGKHLVMTHHATDEYGLVKLGDGTLGQGPTGKRDLHGWKQLGDSADIVAHNYVKMDKVSYGAGGVTNKLVPYIKIQLAEVLEMRDMEIREPTYDLIAGMIRMYRGE